MFWGNSVAYIFKTLMVNFAAIGISGKNPPITWLVATKPRG